MSFGVIILAHTRFDRVQQVAQNWVRNGCPVVIHVDEAVSNQTYAEMKNEMAPVDKILFCGRTRCEWGTWGLVAAVLSAAEELLSQFSDISHVLLTSGSCLPVKPISSLGEFLSRNSGVDFIESVNTLDVKWTVGGLQEERFRFFYPFSWRKQRKLFDWSVRIQKSFPKSFARQPPADLNIHLGSQWWCLSKETLEAIINDPKRGEYDRFFKFSWIPDESYFQTLVRKHSNKIISRSLTLSKFDHFGRPHVFYDDHKALLGKSDCYLARKIWPDAEMLYNYFLNGEGEIREVSTPSPAKVNKIFNDARVRRVQGRKGLYMASRFPSVGNAAVTARSYTVLCGLNDIFCDFGSWLSMVTGARVHGHVFAPGRVEYSEGERYFAGAMSDSPWIRDYNTASFLSALIWNGRGEHQVLQIGPRDSERAWSVLAADGNARIYVVSGAFFAHLARSSEVFEAKKIRAARLQAREDAFLNLLSQHWVSAHTSVWPLGEFLTGVNEFLQEIVDSIGPGAGFRIQNKPALSNMDELGEFLQQLRNSGINPYLAGDLNLDYSNYDKINGDSLGVGGQVSSVYGDEYQ